AAWTDGGVAEQVIVPDARGTPKVWRASAGTAAAPVGVADLQLTTSSPLIVGNKVWFATGAGNAGGVESHAIGATGALGAAAQVSGAPAVPHWNLITDGATIFAATRRTAGATTLLDMYSIDPGTSTIGWRNAAAH